MRTKARLATWTLMQSGVSERSRHRPSKHAWGGIEFTLTYWDTDSPRIPAGQASSRLDRTCESILGRSRLRTQLPHFTFFFSHSQAAETLVERICVEPQAHNIWVSILPLQRIEKPSASRSSSSDKSQLCSPYHTSLPACCKIRLDCSLWSPQSVPMLTGSLLQIPSERPYLPSKSHPSRYRQSGNSTRVLER